MSCCMQARCKDAFGSRIGYHGTVGITSKFGECLNVQRYSIHVTLRLTFLLLMFSSNATSFAVFVTATLIGLLPPFHASYVPLIVCSQMCHLCAGAITPPLMQNIFKPFDIVNSECVEMLQATESMFVNKHIGVQYNRRQECSKPANFHKHPKIARDSNNFIVFPCQDQNTNSESDNFGHSIQDPGRTINSNTHYVCSFNLCA